MECSRCAKTAVLHQAYAGQGLCREHFIQSFEARAKRELAKQGRLPAGRVGVALSGGKDSLALLHFLSGVAATHDDIELVALTVDEGIAGYRDAALDICREQTARLGIPWHVIRTADLSGYSIDEYARGAKGPGPTSNLHQIAGVARPACGPCGVYRRAGLNRLAQQVGCAAVATGHNLDDMAQTILMNHLKGDVERLARLAPHDGPAAPGMVPRLVPFRSIPEKEVLLYALLKGLPLHDDECPYAKRSDRFAIRDVLVHLEEKSPGTRHALLRGHEKLKPLLAALPKTHPRACPSCGEPASNGLCMACCWKAS